MQRELLLQQVGCQQRVRVLPLLLLLLLLLLVAVVFSIRHWRRPLRRRSATTTAAVAVAAAAAAAAGAAAPREAAPTTTTSPQDGVMLLEGQQPRRRVQRVVRVRQVRAVLVPRGGGAADVLQCGAQVGAALSVQAVPLKERVHVFITREEVADAEDKVKGDGLCVVLGEG
jgi:hypothetical protein